MHLKTVFISNYKNLKNFTLNFDGESFIDVFVGKNGSGKSNLFEALIEVFRHIYEFEKDKGDLGFEYSITYEISGKETEIEWKTGKLSINGKVVRTIGKTPLPDNVLIYYSGQNNTVPDLVQNYEANFGKRIKKADFDESRRFIGIGQKYKALLLALLLMQKPGNKARLVIEEKLCISEVGSEMRLELGRPIYAKKAIFDIEDPQTDRYWKPEGITKVFLDRLSKCINTATSGPIRTEGYLAKDDRYVLYLNIAKIQQEFANSSPQELFRQFDNLKTLGMLADISIPLKLSSGLDASIAHFSDGQFQSVYIYSIVELFKDRNCLILLDEPDAFLHPEWQFDFLRQVFDITDAAAKTSHVLMSSHSASTITRAKESDINLFEFDGEKVVLTKVNKAGIIKSLSAGLITFSESEARLSINHFLHSTSGDVLFTEGVTDENILETAWQKLYPDEPCPFAIQNAFDRSFLKNLFSRDELRRNFPNKKMFALFDFDDAYEDWKTLTKNGSQEVTDPYKGLVKRLQHQNHYAALLPVPNIDTIKRQVLDDTGKPWRRGQDCHLSIELLFFKDKWLNTWFKRKAASAGAQIIEFSGDKVKFANNVVPTLDPTDFEPFRPIFEFIKSTCAEGAPT